MTEKEIKVRLIVTNVLFWLGAFIAMCCMGHLDYLDECRITWGIEELWAALGKGLFGLALMGAGMFVGRDLEFDEESEDDDDGSNL